MAENNSEKMMKQLGKALAKLEVKCEQQEDVFSIFYDDSDLPFGTFLVVPKDDRISFFSALPFEIKAKYLQDTLLAINAINGILPCGRFYMDLDLKDNAVFYDQYLMCRSGSINIDDIDRMIRENIKATDTYGQMLFDVNEGKLSISDFALRIKEGAL